MTKKKHRTRPNPKTFSIIDKCPGCEREFGWDTCADMYAGTGQELVNTGGLSNPREVILEVCPDCDTVIAVQVLDNHGGEVYVPSTKEL